MSQNKTFYEWDIETWDAENGDILDHWHADKLSEFRRQDLTDALSKRVREGGVHLRLVLVYNRGNPDDGIVERAWAYVEDGYLPYQFRDAGDRATAVVPPRYSGELTKALSGPLEVGDRVQVKMAVSGGLGPTVWEIVELNGFACLIRVADANNAELQRFDTSLLQRSRL